MIPTKKKKQFQTYIIISYSENKKKNLPEEQVTSTTDHKQIENNNIFIHCQFVDNVEISYICYNNNNIMCRCVGIDIKEKKTDKDIYNNID